MAGVEILARKCANLIALERRSEAEEILGPEFHPYDGQIIGGSEEADRSQPVGG